MARLANSRPNPEEVNKEQLIKLDHFRSVFHISLYR